MTHSEVREMMKLCWRDSVHKSLEGMQGFVCWDACPPQGVSHWRHEFSFMQAIYLCLGFTQTECKNEWLVISRLLMPLIRTRTRFKELVPAVIDCDLSHIGSIGNIQIFMELKTPSGLHYDFACGSNIGVAVGKVQNHPHGPINPVNWPHIDGPQGQHGEPNLGQLP